jgi:hypothetical protein
LFRVPGWIGTCRRGLLWTGLAGTFVLVLVGYWVLISRVWADSLVRTLEVLVAGPFLGMWILGPALWAAWPRRGSSRSNAADEAIGLGAATLLVGAAAYAYVPEFVILPFFLDVRLGVDSLILVLVVPAVQWAVLGVAGATRWVSKR